MAHTKIMGILNVTTDSFYKDSCYRDIDNAVAYGIKLAEQGADILDIGGESTRPGSNPVTMQEELERVIPVIRELRHKLTIPISIDTTKPEVAEKAIEAGAALINDVSGFQNQRMIELAANTGVDICIMHMQGNPKTMQIKPAYSQGVTTEIILWFEKTIEKLLHAGIAKNKIILDPGIGFGKTIADNLEIIHNLPKFKTMEFPLLLGLSRKSFMSKILDLPPEDLLPSTLSLNAVAILQGVDYIRVHDVQEHKRACIVLNELKKLSHTASGIKY